MVVVLYVKKKKTNIIVFPVLRHSYCLTFRKTSVSDLVSLIIEAEHCKVTRLLCILVKVFLFSSCSGTRPVCRSVLMECVVGVC